MSAGVRPKRRRPRRAAALLAVCALAPAGPAAAQEWTRGDHPPPPPGGQFRAPLGAPGDIQFWARNRGIVAVQGTDAVPQGLFVWNGETWHQLATVCGGQAQTTRIAWAGPREFWTITHPSPPRGNGSATGGSGLALCHFRDGEVVASYSAPEEGSPRDTGDPYRRMLAASCNGPSDCWFGGEGSQDPTGSRIGAFHLRWDGSSLRTVYAPQGRGVSDLEAHAGATFESTYVGRGPGNTEEEVDLAEPEPQPRLLHRITGETFVNDPFVPAEAADGGTEVLALDGEGGELWAVGGGATSGPGANGGDPFDRPPLIARLENGAFAELPLDASLFGPDDRFVDVAVVAGDGSVWVALEPFAERGRSTAAPRLAHIATDGSVLEIVTLPAGVGSAARIECTAANDCWLATSAGWLFHYTDGSRPPVDDDPAFAGTITARPNEAAEQFVPDTPPADDSQLFAPPPLEIIPPAVEEPPREVTQRIPAVVRRVRVRRRGRRTIVVSFNLTRPARVGLVAKRGRRTVARRRARLLRRGNHRLTLRLNPRRWPTRIRFVIRLPDPPSEGGGEGDGDTDTGAGDGDTVTTGLRRTDAR